MATQFHFDETYHAEVQAADDRVGTRQGWRAWFYDDVTGLMVTSTRKQILDAFKAAASINLGTPDAEFTAAVCNSIVARRMDKLEAFEIEATFETKDGTEEPPDSFEEFMSQSQNDSPDNPHGPEYSQDGQFMDEYRHEDLDGEKWINGAKDPLQNIPPIPVTIVIDRVSFNQRDKADASQQGIADGRKWLYAVKSEMRLHRNKQTGKMTKYYRVSYEIWTHTARDWAKVKLINVGYREIVDGEYRAITVGEERSPIQAPANLDKQGKQLPAGAEPQFLDFRVLREGALNVPFLT